MSHRHGKLGGTDIGRIVGESEFGGPMDVYREHVEGYEQPETKPMRRGKRLEPVARLMYVEDYGAKLVTPHPGVIHSDKYKFACASVDDLATRKGDELVVDYKTAGEF